MKKILVPIDFSKTSEYASKIAAKIAAKMGAIYLNDTAVPIGKYLVDIKNNAIEVSPTNPRKTRSFLLFPKMLILFLKRKPNVKNKELIDLKKTI